MANLVLTPEPRFQAIDDDGNPIAGGKLYTYAAGTTTPLATYTSAAGTIANQNPIILDTAGRAVVYNDTGLTGAGPGGEGSPRGADLRYHPPGKKC